MITYYSFFGDENNKQHDAKLTGVPNDYIKRSLHYVLDTCLKKSEANPYFKSINKSCQWLYNSCSLH
jgi:hypothetical protein